MATTRLQVNVPERNSLNQAMDNVFPHREQIRNASRPPNTTNQQRVSNPPQVQPSNADTGTSVGDSRREVFETAQNELSRVQNVLSQNQTDDEPTVGESLAGIGGDLNEGPTFEDIYGTAPNEDDVTANQLKLFQAEIDATNQVYDQMLNEARMEGEGRLGSQRAMAARGGLLGSDFGASQKNKVQDFNADIREGIGAERRAAIGAIMGNVRSSVQQQLAEKRQARQQGAENYLSWLASKDQRDNQNAQLIASDLVNAGIDPATLSEDELASITQEAGIGPESVLRTYRQLVAEQEAAEQEAAVDKYKFFSTSEGLVRVDTTTGEAEPVGRSSVPANATITEGEPTTQTVTETTSEQSFEEFLKQKQEEARQSFTPERVNELRQEFEQSRGSTQESSPSLNNLTPSKKQSLEQANLTSAPGDVQTFFLNTPPKFQSFFSRGVALGNFGSDVSARELQTIMEAYEEEESGGSGRSI